MSGRNPQYSTRHPPKLPGRPTPLPPHVRQRAPLEQTRPLSEMERVGNYERQRSTGPLRRPLGLLHGATGTGYGPELTPAQLSRIDHKVKHYVARPARLARSAERAQEAAERRAASRVARAMGVVNVVTRRRLAPPAPYLSEPERELLHQIAHGASTPKAAASAVDWRIQRVVPVSGKLEKLGLIDVTRLHKQTTYEITAAGRQALNG